MGSVKTDLPKKKPLTQKRSYVNFEQEVKNALAQITIEMCRKFSGKARGYMCGYMHQKVQLDETSDEEKERVRNMISCYEYNENIQKQYRSHRDANTFDSTFIERIMRECIGA